MLTTELLPLANMGSFFGMPGIIVLILGLLIFGRRLPEVGKNIGRTIVEFKKGLTGVGDAATEEVEEPAAAKTTPPSKRVTAASPATATKARKSLPQTEEV